jgi:hypothetical protein
MKVHGPQLFGILFGPTGVELITSLNNLISYKTISYREFFNLKDET